MTPGRGRGSCRVAAILAATLALGGCGLGAGSAGHDASIVVTRNFGSQAVGSVTQHRIPGAETVMAMLQRYYRVGTRYGGGFVESIDGQSGGAEHRDWFYYVNGILAPMGAAATKVSDGDEIWWDLHDWSATESVPAVVGSFPEPFTTGIEGRMFPTVLDCAENVQQACSTVASELRRVGVKVSYQLLGGGSGSDSLAVVVGTWADVKAVIAAELIDAGPRHSGVYAQFAGSTGAALELDDPAGRVSQTLHGSAGLIAATEQPSLNAPTWLVTGTDVAGVDRAAADLTAADLRHHFAIAVSGSTVIPLPVSPSQ